MVDIALEEGVRFFVTALGNPREVVDRVHAAGGASVIVPATPYFGFDIARDVELR